MITQQFANLAELKNIGLVLDKARERDVWTSEKNTVLDFETGTKTEKYKGVWNLSQDRLSCIGSSKYRIIQHEEVVNQVVDVLGNLGITVSGFVSNMNDRVTIHILFDGVQVNDGEQGIKYGFRITNSYDMSHSLYGELWAYRLICTNGMMLGRAIPGVRFRRIHMGEVSVRNEIRKFVTLAIESQEQLNLLVSKAMEETLEWDVAQKLLPEVMKVEKYRKLVMEKLEKKERVSRWDIYNAITNVATHGEELTESVREYLQTQAQGVLTTPLLEGN